MKKEREEIFRLFLNCDRLKFSDIEKALKIRSNMVSYHIEQMQKEQLLEKKGEYYFLTAGAEKYIPIFSHVTGEGLGPLPVMLVAVVHGTKTKSKTNSKILLIKRNKRPYKNYWSMIGGKMMHSEGFEDAALRMVKDKTGIDARFFSMNSVFHERVEDDGVIKHSFILFFAKVIVQGMQFKESAHGELMWFNLENIEKNEIIPSDLWLIKHKLESRIDVKSALMDEKEGKLKGFRII